MSYLEDKLRESIQHERKFAPPPGQWEAIYSQIAKDPAPPPTSIGRYLLVFSLVLAFTAGLWLVRSSRIGMGDRPERSTSDIGAFPLRGPALPPGESASARPAIAPDLTTAAPAEKTRPTAVLKTVDPLPAAIREVGEKPAVIGQAIDLPVHPEQSSTAAAQSPESDSLIPRNLSDHLWELEMSKEFRDFAVLDNLESSPIAAVAIAETEKINYRSIKKPAPSYWYFQASWQTIPRGRNGDFKFYQVQPNKAEPVYVPLEGGQEWLELYPQYTEGVFDKGKRWDQNYGFTLGRQFRSGFDISIGAMFYSEPDTRQEVLARVPDNPGQAFVLRTQYWEATYARLDVRYMFRRRHPFKFYFGVTIVGLIQDENIVEDRFYFPERGIDQLITSQVYRGSDLFYLAVPAARAGVLWRLTPNWQVGLDVIMTLPGVQVQYNFP